MYLKKRNAGLDFVRSIAILMVLICHILMWTSTLYKSLYGEFALPFLELIRFGWLGVEIFFVLSGFLIGKILIEEFITNFNGNSRATLAKFYSRRWFRTLPMYYLILVISILLLINTYPELNPGIFLKDATSYFLFLQNFTGNAEFAGVTLMAVSWSLVLEEWFYLLFPLFIVFLRKFSKNFDHRDFFKFLIFFIIGISILRIFYIYLFEPGFASLTAMVFLRLDTFAIGILFAYVHSFLPKIYSFLTGKIFFAAGIVLIALCYFITIHFAYNLFVKSILFTLLPISIAVLIAFMEKNITGHSKTAEVTSKISYSLYLIHVPLLASFLVPYMYVFMDNTVKIPVYVTIIVFFIVTYIVAGIFYKYYEKPMMDLRDNRLIRQLTEK